MYVCVYSSRIALYNIPVELFSRYIFEKDAKVLSKPADITYMVYIVKRQIL
jgi:hypothetical protein